MTVKEKYMKPGDYHLMVSASQRAFQLYEYIGKPIMHGECRCEGAAGPGWRQHNGDTPPGIYRMDQPIWTRESDDYHTVKAPFGVVFIPLYLLSGPPGAEFRQGIGDHGGGSGLGDPMAGRQGWVVTHGCNRYQNEDVTQLAHYVEKLAKTANKIIQEVVW